MEYIIAGIICFSKIDTNSVCLPFEKSPIVYYKDFDKCIRETESIKIKMRKEFNREGFLVDELIIACLKNSMKSNT